MGISTMVMENLADCMFQNTIEMDASALPKEILSMTRSLMRRKT